MGIELNCAEPGCTEMVGYSRDEVSGALLKSPKWLQVERSIGIYLTCLAGHVHRYTITLKRASDDGSE